MTLKLEDAVPDPTLLHETIYATCTNTWSETHGPEHWRRVAKAGLRICQTDNRIDPAVVYLFASFHDSERLTDHADDTWHGPRASILASKLKGGPFDLTSAQMGLLVHACNYHTHEEQVGIGDPPIAPVLDPLKDFLTVGACYDADRLNLMRVLKYPDAHYLTNEEAKRPETIEWGVVDLLADPCASWEELYEEFCALDV